jgi:mannosylglycerate hydrolase
MATNPTYHIVSHSHWDREWYKTFHQFRSMLVNMVGDLLDLLRRDPRYRCFTLDGQAVVLEDYLAVCPEREEEVRDLVRAGRIVIGPWYVLPDEFLVSAEATVRNLLEGGRICQRFGGTMNVGYIPDSFGHIAAMPAILMGFNIPTAVLYRGFGGEKGQDASEYWWVAPDGSRVLLLHLFRNGYSAGYFHQDTEEETLRRFRELKAELDARATTSHRLLLSGGDHHWPDPKLPATIELLQRNFEGEFVQSTLPRYAQEVQAQVNRLSEVHGELRFGYRYAFAVLGGVYSSRMYLKQANWKCQNLLERYVEPFSAWARMEGMRSQSPLVREAWRTLMQNHPHDSICGCSIDPVHREMVSRFEAVEEVGASVLETSLNSLIPYDDRASGDDSRIFLLNPSPFPRTDVANAEVRFFLQDIIVGLNPDVKTEPRRPASKGFALVDADGNEVAYQIVSRQEGYDITYSNHNYPKQTYAERFKLLIDGQDVPPLGYAGYTVRPLRKFPRYSSTLRAGPDFIENRFLRAQVNAHGELTLVDKARKRTYRHLNVFESTGDVGDEYNYSYPRKDKRILSNRGMARRKVLERGPLRVMLAVSLSMRVPVSATPDRKARAAKTCALPVTTTLMLTPNSRALTIETTIDNQAKDHRFRVLFPTALKTDRVLADSQFCVVERVEQHYNLSEFTIEHPARVAPFQRFVAVRDKEDALVLYADGLPEYELIADAQGTLALTLLRSVGLLAGGDLITRPGGKAGWHNETPEAQCRGMRSFRYCLLPLSARSLEERSLVEQEAERFHLPLLSIRRKGDRPLPMRGSLLSIEGPLTLSALKEAEDGQGIVLRVYNTLPAEARGMIRSAREIAGVWRSNLREDRLDAVPIPKGNEIPLAVPARGITTLRVHFQKEEK